MIGKEWIEENHNPQLIELSKQGLSDSKIGQIMGFNASAISYRRNKLGLPSIFINKWTGEHSE